MCEKPPASFIANQISIAICNYMTVLLAKSETGNITKMEFLQNQFPVGAHELIRNAAAQAVDLWNENQEGNENV